VGLRLKVSFGRRCYNSAMATETEKQRALEAIRALPERATLEDAIERLCFIAKIEEGLRQSEAGQVISHEEVKKRFWA
jgi:predicted transcriptional regulator